MSYDRWGTRGSYADWGRGRYIQQLPQASEMVVASFSGGVDLREPAQDAPANSASDALDVEVTDRDRLRPAPGTALVEAFVEREPTQIILHASLDYRSELVLLDPPYMGVKSFGDTSWTDADLPSGRPYGYTNFGGTLVFSNGREGLWSREPGGSIALVAGAPSGHTIASFAGRLFIGAATVGGTREPLGVAWSGASSNVEDWDGEGAGYELLIDDLSLSNYVVSLRTMGLDFLAVLLRQSIWIGTRTGLADRPADFQSRVLGIGCVSDKTAVVTRFGVVFLADTGVYLFDGNQASLLSAEINDAILPLDMDNVELYVGKHNPKNDCYYLFTPEDMWLFDFTHRRWLRRSGAALDAVLFATQFAALTWGQLSGSWGAQTGSWEDYSPRELDDARLLLLGDQDGLRSLVEEDYGSREVFGTALDPYWTTPWLVAPEASRLVLVQGLDLMYKASYAYVEIESTDEQGDLTALRSSGLRQRLEPGEQHFGANKAGLGLKLRLSITDGSAEIERIVARYRLLSPRVEQELTAVVTLTDEGILLVGYYTDFSNYTNDVQPTGWTRTDPLATSYSWKVKELSGATGGKVLEMSRVNALSGEYISALYWDAVGTALTNFQMVIRFRLGVAGDAAGVAGRLPASGADGEFCILEDLGTNRLQLFDTNLSTAALAQTNFAVGVDVWYGMRFDMAGSTLNARAWVWDSEAENYGEDRTVWMLGPTAVVGPPANGRIGPVVHSRSAGTSVFQYDLIGITTDGQLAPVDPPAPGWIVPPDGGYHIRISDFPAGYKVQSGASVFTESGGAVIVNLAVAPATLSVLDSSDQLVASVAAPANLKSYSYSLHYE